MSDATNERLARLCGWAGVTTVAGAGADGTHVVTDVGFPPNGVFGLYEPIPDYTTSLDALCGKDGPVAWAAAQGFRLNVECDPTGSREPGQAFCVGATFDDYSTTVEGPTVTADTPQHALAGAICAAVLALADKLEVKDA